MVTYLICDVFVGDDNGLAPSSEHRFTGSSSPIAGIFGTQGASWPAGRENTLLPTLPPSLDPFPTLEKRRAMFAWLLRRCF